MLDELKDISERQLGTSLGIAKIYVALGEREQAFQSLERAYQNRDFCVIFLKVDPTLDPLCSDPRFQDLMRRVGLSP